MVRQRVRIRFCKQDDLRFIGHRDLMRCMERLFRRAELPLKMSEGFHPKPRMTFPSALAVGIEGIDEIMELELAKSHAAEELLGRLSPHVPPGLAIRSVDVLPPGAAKARVRSVCYQVPVPPRCREGLAEKIDRLLAVSSYEIQRPNRATPLDLRPLLSELTLRDGVLRMRLQVTGQGDARPRDVLRALDLTDLETRGVHLTRSTVEIRP